ncbi:unnamed protein product [Cunninghamella blakesleeana]
MTGSIETLPVIINGAGQSGLALAQSLKHRGIPYLIFERESAPRYHQGWSFLLHFCLPALAANLDPEFYKTFGQHAAVNPHHPTDVEFSFIDGKTLEIHGKLDPSTFPTATGGLEKKTDVYRVNRKRCRGWLLQGIDVQWGKYVDTYDIIDNSFIQVQLNDGTKMKGSCLVGADGVHSNVCRQLLKKNNNKIKDEDEDELKKVTKINPVYNLIITRWLTNEEYEKIRRLSKILLIAFAKIEKKYDYDYGDDDYLSCVISLNDVDLTSDRPNELFISVSRYDPENRIPRYDNDADRLKLLKGWATQALEGDLLDLILNAPEDITTVTTVIIRERNPQADALKNHQGRVTLIGDAAHTMTAFKGEGANHAILDAALLSNQLVKAYNNEISLYEAIENYQKEMIPRGMKAVSESHDSAENTHRSPEKVIAPVKAFLESLNNTKKK